MGSNSQSKTLVPLFTNRTKTAVRALITDVLNADNTYKQAYAAFQQFDTDGSNTITVAEVRVACQYLDDKLSEEQIGEMVQRMDRDGNGIIDFDEFAKAWACGL